jgi:hypothetical protein
MVPTILAIFKVVDTKIWEKEGEKAIEIQIDWMLTMYQALLKTLTERNVSNQGIYTFLLC